MTSDDQQFLDMLSSVADSIDRHIDNVAASLRETLSSYKWIQETILPPSTPSRIRKPVPAAPPRFHDIVYTWLTRNKILVTAVLVTLGTGGWFLYQKRRQNGKRRRASRASNGARKEVVVIAGSPNEPVCRSISLDLERRGFIVYVIVNSTEEEQMVHNESRMDIRPLNLDITDPSTTQTAIERFHQYLITPQHAFLGADPHHLTLAGLIIMPDTVYSSGPICTLGPEVWSDALNVKILGTVAMTQALLPLIQESNCRTLMLTPNITSSLSLPNYSLETTIISALEAFTRSLQAEGIKITHLRLGHFDYGIFKPHGQHHHHHHPQQQLIPAPRAGARPFQPGGNNNKQKNEITGQGVKGSPLRELHVAVFDVLTGSRTGRVCYVGRGSLVYDLLGRWAPTGLVGWMMGIRMRRDLEGGRVLGPEGR